MPESAIIVTHHIFLNKEQRYALQTLNQSVTLIGVSSPMWVIDGKWKSDVAHEVFCKYEVRFAEKDDQTICLNQDGYTVTITGDMPKNLKDYEDGGSECLMLTHRNVVKNMPILHCIEIEDMDRCIKTLCD